MYSLSRARKHEVQGFDDFLIGALGFEVPLPAVFEGGDLGGAAGAVLLGEEDVVVLTGVEGWVEVDEVDGLVGEVVAEVRGCRRAIQSLRLRLHSGLRQSGSSCGAAFLLPVLKSGPIAILLLGLKFWPIAILLAGLKSWRKSFVGGGGGSESFLSSGANCRSLRCARRYSRLAPVEMTILWDIEGGGVPGGDGEVRWRFV